MAQRETRLADIARRHALPHGIRCGVCALLDELGDELQEALDAPDLAARSIEAALIERGLMHPTLGSPVRRSAIERHRAGRCKR